MVTAQMAWCAPFNFINAADWPHKFAFKHVVKSSPRALWHSGDIGVGKSTMEIKRGTATNVRHTKEIVEIEGGQIITHISLFVLDGRRVKFKSSNRPWIKENDSVCVAGQLNGGEFTACAYKNFTNGLSGDEFGRASARTTLVAGLMVGLIYVAAGMGAGMVAFIAPSDPKIVPLIVGLVFFGTGLVVLHKANQLSKAARLLKSQKR